MGTRGGIGRFRDGRIEFRYHNMDSYPQGLGKTLLERAYDHFDGDTHAMIRYFLDDHPAGWSNVVGSDFSHDVGFTHEHDEVPHIWTDTGYVENPNYVHHPQCYCHGERSDPAEPLYVCDCDNEDGSRCDPVFIEYFYVIDWLGLSVYFSAPFNGSYRHFFYTCIPWGTDVDWDAMDDHIMSLKREAYEHEGA